MQNSVYDVNNNQRNLDLNLNPNFLIKKDSKISDNEKSDLTTNPTNNIKSAINDLNIQSPFIIKNSKIKLSEYSESHSNILNKYQDENLKEKNNSFISFPQKSFRRAENEINELNSKKNENLHDLSESDNKSSVIKKVNIF